MPAFRPAAFLLAILPLAIFFTVDALAGTLAAMGAAAAVGGAELAWRWHRDRRLDGAVLLDTGVALLLGLLMLDTGNTTLDALRPGLLEAVTAALLGFLALGGPARLGAWFTRYQGTAPDPLRLALLRRFLGLAFWGLALHAALLLAAPLAWGREAAARVENPGLWILGGCLLAGWAWQVVAARRSLARDEWLPLVTPEGAVVGRAPRRLVHGDPSLLHPVVYLHVVDADGRLVLQKRSRTKAAQPGKWDAAVGGHVLAGESVEQALARETREELGIDPGPVRFLAAAVVRTDAESELGFSFLARHDGPFSPDPAEIAEIRPWSAAELERARGGGELTPALENALGLLRPHLR